MLNYFLKTCSNKSSEVYECPLPDFVNFILVFLPLFLQYWLRYKCKSTTRSQKTDWSHWQYPKFCLAETVKIYFLTATGYSCFSRLIYLSNSSNHTFWANYFRVPGCRNQMVLLLFLHPTAVNRLKSSTWKYFPEWENQDLALSLAFCVPGVCLCTCACSDFIIGSKNMTNSWK